MDFIYCLLFGVLILLIDFIVVFGIFKFVGVLKLLVIIIVGELLFNDGIVVVVFVIIFGIF